MSENKIGSHRTNESILMNIKQADMSEWSESSNLFLSARNLIEIEDHKGKLSIRKMSARHEISASRKNFSSQRNKQVTGMKL